MTNLKEKHQTILRQAAAVALEIEELVLEQIELEKQAHYEVFGDYHGNCGVLLQTPDWFDVDDSRLNAWCYGSQGEPEFVLWSRPLDPRMADTTRHDTIREEFVKKFQDQKRTAHEDTVTRLKDEKIRLMKRIVDLDSSINKTSDI